MVVAFGEGIDAGRAGTGAVRHLVSDLPAERFARIEPEEFFVLTQERPEVRLTAGGGREIPHHLQDSAIQALVSYVSRLLDLSPDMSHFAEEIQPFRAQCDGAVARGRATRGHVRWLEQEYDAAEATGEKEPLPGGDLD